jgi:hypothetical protein
LFVVVVVLFCFFSSHARRKIFSATWLRKGVGPLGFKDFRVSIIFYYQTTAVRGLTLALKRCDLGILTEKIVFKPASSKAGHFGFMNDGIFMLLFLSGSVRNRAVKALV